LTKFNSSSDNAFISSPFALNCCADCACWFIELDISFTCSLMFLTAFADVSIAPDISSEDALCSSLVAVRFSIESLILSMLFIIPVNSFSISSDFFDTPRNNP